MDTLFHLLEAVDEYLTRQSWIAMAIWLVGSFLVLPMHVLIHELGHATMAWMLGHSVQELRVGNDDDNGLTIHRRSFTLRFGPITGERDYAGYVALDGTRVGAWHFLLIALAGPVASLAAGLAGGFAMIALQQQRFLLLMVLVGGLEIGVSNLSRRASDGRQVRLAWRMIRSREPAEPHALTSVPPPGY